MKKVGRPRKNARGNKSWDARLSAQALREAVEIAQQKPEARFDNPDPNTPNPDLVHKGRAACTLGCLILDCCDPADPATFLRMIADELDGKLRHDRTDERIYKAFLESRTWPEFEQRYEQLSGRKLDKDKDKGTLSSLRRSLERISGFRLYKSGPKWIKKCF